MALDGVAASPADLDTCANAYDDATCSELSGALIGQCIPKLKGSRPDGSPCATMMQCAGGWCELSGTGGTTCGVCATLPGEGEVCTDGRCDFGLACSNMTCTRPVYGGLGDPCNVQGLAPCDPALACIDGACAPRRGQGEACAFDSECGVGLECDDLSSTCQPPPPPAPVGGACSGAVQCDSQGYCEQDVCQLKVADGGSCTESRQCMVAANCISGTCTIGPPSCG